MENLWKKESNNGDSLYVDFFGNTSNNEEFEEWNRQLSSSIWKHRFHTITVDPTKSNETSNMFRIKGNYIFRGETPASSRISLESRWNISMELYSRSLIFAEIGTENVSLAYANRSVCFFNLKMYEKCLMDIDHAMKANYPQRLMPKLEKRKADCLRLMQAHVQIRKKYDTPKLDFDADKNFPSLANVLAIKRNNEFGRLIEAKCDIDVGKTVLVEETFVSVGTNNILAFCFTCLKREMCFIACSQCTDVMFCSDDCMNQNNIHKMTCGALYHRMPLNIKTALQSVLIAINAIPNVEDLMDCVKDHLALGTSFIPTNLSDWRSKYGLFLNLNVIRSPIDTLLVYKIYTTLLATSSIKLLFDSKRKQRFLMHLVAQHTLIRQSNNFMERSDDTTFNISSVAVMLSFINHSCAPNLFNFAVNNQELCVTIRPIKKGEQLFISYTSPDDTTIRRQTILKLFYGFDCKCEKCRPHDMPTNFNEMKADPCFTILQHLDATDIVDIEQRKQYEQMSINFLNKYGHLPWSEEVDAVVNIFKKLIFQ